MMNDHTYTLVDNQSGDLAFKLYRFESIRHLDHIQRLNYYSIIWIKEGEGTAIIDTEKYHYTPNQIFSFSPYQPFMFSPENKTEGVVINFHPDFFCIHKHHTEVACDGVLFNNIYEYPYIEVDVSESQTLEWIITEMEKDIEQNTLATNEAILSYLKLFLINCSRVKKKQQPEVKIEAAKDDDNFVVQKLKDYIESNFKSMHSPKDYANLLHISPNALAKVVKSTYNKTLSALISERIIIEAKRELYLTNKTVDEIALELGYNDPFYFSRFFKKHTDISPSTYRKTIGYNKSGELSA